MFCFSSTWRMLNWYGFKDRNHHVTQLFVSFIDSSHFAALWSVSKRADTSKKTVPKRVNCPLDAQVEAPLLTDAGQWIFPGWRANWRLGFCLPGSGKPSIYSVSSLPCVGSQSPLPPGSWRTGLSCHPCIRSSRSFRKN